RETPAAPRREVRGRRARGSGPPRPAFPATCRCGAGPVPRSPWEHTTAGPLGTLRQVTLLVGWHPSFADHDAGDGHPERPSRLRAVEVAMEVSGVSDGIDLFEPRAATPDEIGAVHPGRYLQALQELTSAGGGYIDGDTAASEGSWD